MRKAVPKAKSSICCTFFPEVQPPLKVRDKTKYYGELDEQRISFTHVAYQTVPIVMAGEWFPVGADWYGSLNPLW